MEKLEVEEEELARKYEEQVKTFEKEYGERLP